MIAKRSIVSCILLSIFTCGLYYIFGWLPGIANDVNNLDRGTRGPDGVTVILLTIVTCGIYGIYFVYTASKRIYYLFEDANMRASDNSIINLILFVANYFVPLLSLVALAIMQNDINNYLDANAQY